MKCSRGLQQLILVTFLIKNGTCSHPVYEAKQCIGKHQIPLENLYAFKIAKELSEPIITTNFDVLPVTTILENNDRTVMINMTYNTSVPTINFGASAGLPTYRFAFLYFQWYKNSTTNLLAPFELHAVFFNDKMKYFRNALKGQNFIAILAFSVKVEHPAETKYDVLNKNLKAVKNGLSKTLIENLPLSSWLPEDMAEYISYEGYMPLYNCEVEVLWVDLVLGTSMAPELIKEFQLLQTYSSQALVKQYQPFLQPIGPLVVNYEAQPTAGGGSLESIPLVDAYEDDDNVAFGVAVQISPVACNVVLLILFLNFFLFGCIFIV